MSEYEKFVPQPVLACLKTDEKSYLDGIFKQYRGFPSLQDLWKLMDEQWSIYGCDPNVFDERIASFYQHPVWLLNGLFIEQDSQSIKFRQALCEWASTNHLRRIADYGGGFGNLARLLGKALPEASVDIVEPYPHPGAIALASKMPNVRYIEKPQDEYDLVIATDVFEHVLDPIGLAYQIGSHLSLGGYYMIANCFQPVIKCHLPQHLHLQIGWDPAMERMGLKFHAAKCCVAEA